MSRFTFSIKTMGCKANIYDSLVLERELVEIGGARSESLPDVFVLNTCTVTAEADKQAHYQVNYAKKRAPDAFTIVTGCYAQVAAEKVRENPNVGLVVPNDGKNKLKELVAKRFDIPLEQTERDPEIFWGQLPLEVGKTRAFIKIQEGCNDFCTYCIIPYARGKSRSVRAGAILEEIKRLSEQGVNEVVLTGTNIADYGKEFDSSLEDLIEAILAHTSIPRLRLTSLDPSEISDRILGLITPGGRLMPHIHVSLQSPVSRVLRAMKRNYRSEEVRDALQRIYARSSDIFVGMDVIAGFPSETAAEHAEALRILEETPWTRLHVFPYSEREGTPATRIAGNVPVGDRRARAQDLMRLSNKRHESFTQKFIGREIGDVLFESWHEAGGDFFAVGHAANYMRVMARVPSRTQAEAEAMHQKIGSARIVGASPKPAQDWTLEGVLSSSPC